MDITLIQLIATVVFGSGGILGGISAVRAWRAKRRGMPAVEEHAVIPGWGALTAYYQKELDSLRGDLRSDMNELRRKVTRLERLRSLDSQYIDALEAHIWNHLPPPPPARPQYPANLDED